MLLLIDNYDSFTYNLADYFKFLGQEVVVIRNDELSLSALINLKPEFLVISPGPCTPNESGISLQAISYFKGKIPILGVCLGHQCIAQYFKAEVIKAPLVMHGKSSIIHHTDHPMFEHIPMQYEIVRYHSLIVEHDSLPKELTVTAKTNDTDLIMALAHKELPIWGVQFHPESILSEHGHRLLANFLSLS